MRRLSLVLLTLAVLAGSSFGEFFVPSPNMGLPIPEVGIEPGPQYATDLNNALTLIDQHNHSPGQGVQVTPSGLNISTDLPFLNNNATQVRSCRFTPQGSPLSGVSDRGAIYESGVDLYYNDGNGNQVRITQSGGVAGSPGSISNLNSPASASYVGANSTFVWQSAASTPANLDAGAVIFRNIVASSNGITVQPPNSIASNYTITWPSLPGSTSFLTIDPSGGMAATISTANGITRSNLSAVGQQVSSASTGSYTSTSPVDITNLTVTITTTGRPVRVFCMSSSNSSAGRWRLTRSNSHQISAQLYVVRDASTLADIGIGMLVAASSTGFSTEFYAAPGALEFLDTTAGAGTYTYKIQAAVNSSSTSLVPENLQLVAYEL